MRTRLLTWGTLSLLAGLALATGGVIRANPAALSPSSARLSSWILNTTGLTGHYVLQSGGSGDLLANVSRVRYNSSNVYINAYGIPSYDIGPFGNAPLTPQQQNYTFRIPAEPATGNNVPSPQGQIGVMVNGVPVYNPGDNFSYDSATSQDRTTQNGGDQIWNRLAFAAELTSIDACYGHPTPGGSYHNHVDSPCLRSDLGDTGAAHSPIIGWAFDGYPIYGPYGYSSALDVNSVVTRMASSYRLQNITTRTNGPNVSGSFPLGWYAEDYEYVSGLGDLDDHNGRFGVTPEFPEGTYAYFVTLDANGDPAYPYFIGRTFYGAPAMDNFGQGTVTVPSGVLTYSTHATLTITFAGAGRGSVVSASPAITCTATCLNVITYGTTLTLTAAPETPNFTFAGWSGACSGTGTCVITLEGDQNVTATFNVTGATSTATATATNTTTPTNTATPTHTATATPTGSATNTASPTATPTCACLPTTTPPTATPTGSATTTATATSTSSATVATATQTATNTATATATQTATPQATATASQTATPNANTIPPSGGVITNVTQGLTVTLNFPPGVLTETITVTLGLTGSHPLPSGLGLIGNGAFFIEARHPNGQPMTQFSAPFTLTLRFTAAQVVGRNLAQVAVFFWDANNNRWAPLPTTLNRNDNTLVITLNHLTEFAALAPTGYPLYLPLVQK